MPLLECSCTTYHPFPNLQLSEIVLIEYSKFSTEFDDSVSCANSEICFSKKFSIQTNNMDVSHTTPGKLATGVRVSM